VQALALADRDTLVTNAQHIEALGYDELYSYDHFGTVDPFVPLMVAAEATTRLRVGPLVLNNEFHQPALLARTAATVDRLSGGRLVLGLGTGYAQAEHDAIGLTLRAPRERVDRFAECVGALRLLLDHDQAHVEGEHHQFGIDKLGVRPLQDHVPFLIGGHGRRVVGIAAQFADIFQFTGLTHAADGTPQPGGFSLDAVRRRATWLTDDAGDRAGLIERSTLVQLVSITDGGDARLTELADEWELPADLLRETPFALIGSIAQVIDKLERLREELGISHVVVRDADAFAPVVDALAGR
jgi:probable F420-dependent oxidoreductase